MTPMPESMKTSFNLPKALHKKLKIAAVHEDRDMSELVAEAIGTYLAKTRSTRND